MRGGQEWRYSIILFYRTSSSSLLQTLARRVPSMGAPDTTTFVDPESDVFAANFTSSPKESIIMQVNLLHVKGGGALQNPHLGVYFISTLTTVLGPQKKHQKRISHRASVHLPHSASLASCATGRTFPRALKVMERASCIPRRNTPSPMALKTSEAANGNP